ncbi:hypothetical protein G0U57_008903 [Chelydra serpentina]|uniref:Myb/SANT-like DNA-binding domain-containing protein n=1 Tax=Chelydra serpentina TaxID=8475 RepID=A0A8T1SFZ4_CHESE|nr:hypothetical protein G0U57_008903 [Chelydra serpentina]
MSSACCTPADTYGQISRCMTERGPDRDTLQCRVKVKELQNTNHMAQEANPAPMSCWFYKELDAILGSNPTSTAKTIVDTSVAVGVSVYGGVVGRQPASLCSFD